MEPRRLMAGGLNAFASIPIPAPPMSGGMSAVTFRIQRGDFTMGRGGSIWLRVADNGSSVAGPTLGGVTATSMTPRGLISRNAETRALPGGQELVKVGFGTYNLSVGPVWPSTPLGSVSFAMAGAAAAGSAVDAGSLAAIRTHLGQNAGSPEFVAAADVNGDGVINRADLRLARQNLGARTSVQPLAVDVTTNLSPIDDLISNRTISIQSSRPASLSVAMADPTTGALGTPLYLDTSAGGSARIDAGDLTDSYDAFQAVVQASDRFGQYVQFSAQIPGAIGEGNGDLYANEWPYNPSLAPPASESQDVQPSSSVPLAYMPPVYDQGQRSSCVANAFAWDYAYVEKKEGLTGASYNDPSRLFMYYNARAYQGVQPMMDKGTWNAALMQTMTTQGVAPESSWSYSMNVNATPTAPAYAAASSHHVLQYYQLNNLNLTQIEGSIAAGFPVVVGLRTFPSFDTPETKTTGVIPMPAEGEQADGGHSVVLVGYNNTTGQFTFVNSWGNHWGVGGLGSLYFGYVEQYGSGLYSIRQDN